MQSSRGPNEAHESRGFDYQFDIASEREFENIREVITPGGGDRQLSSSNFDKMFYCCLGSPNIS